MHSSGAKTGEGQRQRHILSNDFITNLWAAGGSSSAVTEGVNGNCHCCDSAPAPLLPPFENLSKRREHPEGDTGLHPVLSISSAPAGGQVRDGQSKTSGFSSLPPITTPHPLLWFLSLLNRRMDWSLGPCGQVQRHFGFHNWHVVGGRSQRCC